MRFCLKGFIVVIRIVLGNQTLYTYCIQQVYHLFENRLSDKSYFRIFAHVVFISQKQTYNMG
jgi:hypothetical protein